jgi:hypothetical protein
MTAPDLPVLDLPPTLGSDSVAYELRPFGVFARAALAPGIRVAEDLGLDVWTCRITYPDLQFQPEWGPVVALLRRAAGGRALLRIADPSRLVPWGRAAGISRSSPLPAIGQPFSDGTFFSDGTGFADGASSTGALFASCVARQDFLPLSGLIPNQSLSLMALDLIQIGRDLYEAQATVASDAQGRAVVPVLPRLRRPLLAGTPVKFVAAGALFQLTAPAGMVALRPPSQATVTLDLVEYIL